MRENSKRKTISGPAALLLLGVFAVCILLVLLLGANSYRRLTQRGELSYDGRTCAQYIATKVRQANSVSLERFGESDALVIAQEVDGEVYLDRVYCCDGWLMELFSAQDGSFAPEDGEKVLRAESLTLTQEGSLLTVEIVHDGQRTRVQLALRVGEEGAA